MNISCLGAECPVRNTCKRYTGRKGVGIRKCTNQRGFVQDESKINGDSLRR